jgi:hypothetical protein
MLIIVRNMPVVSFEGFIVVVIIIIIIIIIIISWVKLIPLGIATTGLLYQTQKIDDNDDCGAIGRMKIGRGN